MNLLDVFGKCNGTKRLGYEEDFKQLRWGYNDYFRYMSFCDEIRAAVIVSPFLKDLDGVTIVKRDEMKASLVDQRVQALFDWLQAFSDSPLPEPKRAFQWLSVERSYHGDVLYHSRDKQDPDPELLYQASFHFQLSIEEFIARTLKQEQLWYLNFDFRDLSEYSDQELKERIDLLKTEISRLEDQEPEFPEDVDRYTALVTWAKKQTNYSYLSDYEDRLYDAEEELDRRTPPRFNPQENVLYIYRWGNIVCKKHSHRLLDVNCIVPSPSGEIKINAQYCFDCRKFIISETSFRSYQELYEVLPMKLCYVEKDGSFPQEVYRKERADISPLRLAGYTVRKKNGMTEEERQTLLAFLIDQGIMEKYEIIGYLEQFININGAKFENRFAVIKWQADAAFVRRYGMEHQETYAVEAVRRY